MRKLLAVATVILVLGLAGCGAASEPQHTLTFIEGRKVTVEMNGEDLELAGVFCEYTNASGETFIPCDAINVYAFQHGTEIPVLVFTGQETEGFIQCDTRVQSGTTAKVVWLFQMQDDSTVSVEFTDGQKFTFEVA